MEWQQYIAAMPNNTVKFVPQIEQCNSCNEIKMENNKH